MNTSVIGFPRIGAHRELKFASEKYFANTISQEELEQAAKQIRLDGWKKQAEAGIGFISSNDFSFYDGMLDTAFMLGAIPARYKSLCLSKLDTFFAMARGFQSEKSDVTALPMKKWFNTNYHYIVPEIEESTELRLDATKIASEYKEAAEAGIKTKINVIGPFTFLKLAHYSGAKNAASFADDAAKCYKQLLAECAKLGAEWLQIEEPYLVFDLTDEDKQLFKELYEKILAGKQIKVLLQTYFGDVRDFYTEIIKYDFDAFGLDFVEGKESLNLLKKYGFPKGKKLFAGVVNGKNIWRNNYEKTAALIAEIEKAAGAEIVISTSCSLLHVPYTTKNEEKFSAEILSHFAFAEEKLKELKDIADADSKAFAENKKLFAHERVEKNLALADKISKLTAKDFTRVPAFAEREAIQKKALNLPPFPTTTIGSFPQTQEVRKNRADFKKGLISKEQYEDFNKKMIARCIKKQEEIGLDVLVHGEFERNDMVEYFGENLDGYIFTQKAWVQSYGTRCVKPPVVWGDITRKNQITVDWSVYAQGCADKNSKKPVKGMLTGPVTILNWSFPREDISLKECAFQIAFAIRDEVLDLEANGIRIIQIDEAALKEKLPLRKADWHSEYLDWAISAFNLVHSGCKAETQIHTHMCYSEFIPIITDIDNMDADVITFEASRSNLEILQALKEKNFRTEVGPGVYDIHSPRVPSVEEIVAAVNKMKQFVKPSKLWINPDCGLKTRGETETDASLKNLVAAAKKVRASV
ncbi:MAG: 5-methyltetrahydropteroyltriglutamate--homocysteine S-methyltransferase [Spirochaetaceae bacterium]|nr:5-methyltetrahydropteroyltriglutamate--homocysteine S-methyltransferase [Spirochaetaceae bacterium]